jgi:hypothetical protein
MATLKPKITDIKDKLTRARAEYDLTHGKDPRLAIYLQHKNKHVREKALRLAKRIADKELETT